ncbi:unnamed protein product [Caenorhabditis angaria]|uniref:KANL2-like probable zinc-finger domain-containing protein n=1 Tax=Caenorhabditis angaria TaxID=860376 RepID=A0A9P1INU8_9PELO|nr:unnamed protein product [Caenorhabditis angaria]
MIKSPGPSRPPGQYVPAKNTQFNLIDNEYDKNTYAQCNYTSYRTLMRCKQIRPKEELVRNSGKCEEHDKHAEMLRNNRNKEELRIRAECDNLNGKRRKFHSIIVSNDYVSDEEDYLQSCSSLPNELPDKAYDNTIDSDPMRHAEIFTEKDILRLKIKYLKQDIDDLNQFYEMLEAEAAKTSDKLNDSSSRPVVLDVPQIRALESIQEIGRKDYPRAGLDRYRGPREVCRYGRSDLDLPDSIVIPQILENLLDKTCGKVLKKPIEPCRAEALARIGYCKDHIFHDKANKLFTHCTICGHLAVATDDPTCPFHMKKIVGYRCLDPQYNTRKGEEDVRTPGHDLYFEQNHQRGSQMTPIKHVIIDDEDEDDMRLGNLGHIETMPSPLASLGMGFGPAPRGIRTIIAPPYIQSSGPTPAQRAAQLRLQQQRDEVSQAELARAREEQEEKTSKCARARPLHPDYFNKEDNVALATAQTPTNTVKNIKHTNMLLHHPSAPTPRLIPSSTHLHTFPPPPQNPQQQRAHYMSTLQHPTMPTQKHYTTKYPLPRRAPGVTGTPVAIPLDAQINVHDDDPSLPHYTRLEKNVPRGVPYVKHGTSFRKSEDASASASASQLHPKPLPIIKTPATHQPKAIAPHREIAKTMANLASSSYPRPLLPPPPPAPRPPKFHAGMFENTKDAPMVVPAGADPKMDVKSYLALRIGGPKDIEDRVNAISQAQKTGESAEKVLAKTPTIVQKIGITSPQIIRSPVKTRINESPLGRPPRLVTTPAPSASSPIKRVAAPIPQPLPKGSPVKNLGAIMKRKITLTPSAEEPEAKKAARPSRAAAIAANQAMNTKKPPTTPTTPSSATPSKSTSSKLPSTPSQPSTSSISSSTSAPQPSPLPPSTSTTNSTSFLDPLSVLAAVSEIEREKEEKDRESKSSSISPKSTHSKEKAPRRSSRGQKSNEPEAKK